ncbi:hypothetical protein Tco_1254695 [Tanacetum coccineum]
MAPKRTSTSTTPTMTQTAIRKLVVDSITATLEEAVNIAQRLMDQVLKHNSVQGTNNHKQKFDDRRTFTNNKNNYRNNNNNRNNDHHQQQNRRQETFRAYAATPTKNSRILKRVGPVAYTLELPKELNNVHNTFYVSNLKKCLSDESVIIPIKELRLDNKLNFVEEPVEIMDREASRYVVVRTVTQLPLYELEHVELQLGFLTDRPVYLDVVHAILGCCRPRSPTLVSDFSSHKFVKWNHLTHVVQCVYEKLLRQEDNGHINIQFALSSSVLKGMQMSRWHDDDDALTWNPSMSLKLW